MKFFLGCAVWLLMAALLGTGIVLAMHGSYLLLILSLASFVLAAGAIGCRQH